MREGGRTAQRHMEKGRHKQRTGLLKAAGQECALPRLLCHGFTTQTTSWNTRVKDGRTSATYQIRDLRQMYHWLDKSVVL